MNDMSDTIQNPYDILSFFEKSAVTAMVQRQWEAAGLSRSGPENIIHFQAALNHAASNTTRVDQAVREHNEGMASAMFCQR